MSVPPLVIEEPASAGTDLTRAYLRYFELIVACSESKVHSARDMKTLEDEVQL